MENNLVIEKLKILVKEKFLLESSGHDWWHTYRVYKNSIKIFNMENNPNIDIFILKVSALLHDIADHKEGYTDNDRKNIITKLLQNLNIENMKINKIVNIVNSISFSKGKIPELLEGKIVQDADRLDAMGAIGIARTFAFGGNRNRALYNPEKNNLNNSNNNSDSIQHFYDKLLLLKNKMNTVSAMKLAEKKDNFMKIFLDEFLTEWNLL
ncbi:MAG: HD domain-containing protein [Fusobacteriaceae bacterium]